MRRIAAGLVGLGLIGGAGAVAYDSSGTPTVTIENQGKKEQVTLATDADGDSYSCPPGVQDKLSPHDITAGRIKLTLQRVRRQEKAIDKNHPDHTAPKATVEKYNRLLRRDDRLVDSYNAAVDNRNKLLAAECTRA